MSQVTLAGFLVCRSLEEADRVSQLLPEHIRLTRAEPGCLRFDILRDNDDPCKFFFCEVYRDEAARLSHRDTPQFGMWMEFAAKGLDREIVRHITTVVHPPEETWR